ncbi:hypothetical protein [Pedobacter namyangjuensis]|uniref:hypothetical protein n=1 Tax=Pedobacter namyangjuensis TaxID=600626 RepID=UPI0013B4334A|nr:hypothetical protein [Pedobacter namyangjuensis]
MPILSKDVSKSFKNGDIVFIKSKKHNTSIVATIIKYIPHGEWYCSFTDKSTKLIKKDYFSHDEID